MEILNLVCTKPSAVLALTYNQPSWLHLKGSGHSVPTDAVSHVTFHWQLNPTLTITPRQVGLSHFS